MYKHFFKRLFDLIIALFALPFVLLLIPVSYTHLTLPTIA